MKKFKKEFILSIVLISISFFIYTMQFLIFKDKKDTLFYLFQDLAFVPINIVILTLIVDKIVEKNEKDKRIEKNNIVIGMFFNEFGTELLKYFISCDKNIQVYKDKFIFTENYIPKDIDGISIDIDGRKLISSNLKNLLMENRKLILGLFSNEVLLEHDQFTELLWSIVHLQDEILFRKDVSQISEEDYNHLSNDALRAYNYLLIQWIEYLKHMKINFPYIFKLAIKTNPFNNI